MRRHIVAGHFGPTDPPRLPRVPGVVNTKIDLVSSNSRLDHGIDGALAELSAIGIFPSEIGVDLLVLAALSHAADTRISRETESQDTWTREIELVVPVSDSHLWQRVAGLMANMLDFLSGDRWTFTFRPRPDRFAQIAKIRAEGSPPSNFNCLSLFSGGLDSLIGAIDLLHAGVASLFISHAGEGATSGAQAACFEALQAQYQTRCFSRLRMWMNFPLETVRNVASEKTTRARSFLFFAIGVFAGTGLGRPFTIRVPENGFIALNVPLDILRLGALSTRTTHPYYMARWNELLTNLGVQGRIENPYWDKTKGEMVQACADQALLRRLVPKSLSCASPAKARWQGHPVQHCGYCLPCLIRRASIEKAWGQGNDPTTYTLSDLRAVNLDPNQAEGQQIRAFQFAVARIRSKPGIEKILVHKPGSLNDVKGSVDDLAAVYRRGMEEIAVILDGVQTRRN